MSTTNDKRTIIAARVSWQADHEQYWQGHGVAFSDYDECATSCGESLREAWEDALEQLAQNDIRLTDAMEAELLADLGSDIDTCIVDEYCDNHGNDVETVEECSTCEGTGDDLIAEDEDSATCDDCEGSGEVKVSSECDCAVCAGDWHYYVNIDVKVGE